MDLLKNALAEAGGQNEKEKQPEPEPSLFDKLHGLAGGGKEAEKQEDHIDKAVDFFQEHVLKQGPQDNESVLEQAKDKQIAGVIRGVLGQEKK